jgi:hypothetical protein
VEQIEMREHAPQIRQLPPSYEDQLTSGLPKRTQRRDSLFGNQTVFGQSAVVIGRERDEVHTWPSKIGNRTLFEQPPDDGCSGVTKS